MYNQISAMKMPPGASQTSPMATSSSSNYHHHHHHNNLTKPNVIPALLANVNSKYFSEMHSYIRCPPIKSFQNGLDHYKFEKSHPVSLKSKLGVEYRRYAVSKSEIFKFESLYMKVKSMHKLDEAPFTILYMDQDGELLPINNDDNLAKAIDTAAIFRGRPYLKLYLEREGVPSTFSGLTMKSKRRENLINMFIPNSSTSESRPRIGMPEDFRQVSSIIDADILPAGRRRVVLNRGSKDQDKLGFYIRDGVYQKMNAYGQIEKTHGIFISRIVPGALADTTNLLAENDEIIEVNGIEVSGNKTLDQVRDMMLANSSNLIITIRPAKPMGRHV